MKIFTAPDGVFEIQIPIDWDYRNEIFGFKNESPFSFEPFKNSLGCFQLSYYKKEKDKYQGFKNNHNYFQNNLKFEKGILEDNDNFKIITWATTVQDYFFMAKYIYQPKKVNQKDINKEIDKVENVLSSLMCIEPKSRLQAKHFFRFEKFNAALAATFDLKYKAFKNKSPIEIIVLNANQIDAYLRLAIVLKYQISEKTDLFRLEYLFQDESDRPIMEKQIYKKALELQIINQIVYDKLFELYNKRNKVVHRYIITDIKTFNLHEYAYQYEQIAEDIRVILEKIEKEQFEKKVGYYKSKNPHREKNINEINWLKSLVNEKHFMNNFYRDLK